jgi:hypothetical protein
MGPCLWTKYYVLGVVALQVRRSILCLVLNTLKEQVGYLPSDNIVSFLQFFMAILAGQMSWYSLVAAAYVIGGTANSNLQVNAHVHCAANVFVSTVACNCRMSESTLILSRAARDA